MQLIRGLLFIFLGVSVQLAKAESRLQGLSGFSREYPRGSLHEFILGPVCLSLQASRQNLNCNPAYLAFEEKRLFRAGVVGNSDLAKVDQYRERLAEDDKVGIVDTALESGEPTLARAAAVTSKASTGCTAEQEDIA
jgi:hypothetical protein